MFNFTFATNGFLSGFPMESSISSTIAGDRDEDDLELAPARTSKFEVARERVPLANSRESQLANIGRRVRKSERL